MNSDSLQFQPLKVFIQLIDKINHSKLATNQTMQKCAKYMSAFRTFAWEMVINPVTAPISFCCLVRDVVLGESSD